MPLTTTVTPAKVAVALGQPAPSTGSPIEQQWQTWIDDQLMFIQDRADNLAVTAIPQAKIDFVIREVVVDQVKRRDQANDYEIPEDYRFRTVADWWPLLGLTGKDAGAYAIDTVPAVPAHLPWCSIYFGSTDYIVQDGMIIANGGPGCSCGVDIAGYPIYETGGDA